MRPTATRQSALAAPLNSILGTAANVRILRVLATSRGEVTVGDLTRAAELSAPGARKALRALEATGVVRILGKTKGRRAQLTTRHPLAKTIINLFRAEADRVVSLERDLADLLGTTAAIAAWIEGPVALGRDRVLDPIDLCVLADAVDVDHVTSAIEDGIGPIELQSAVVIQLRTVTRADLESRRPRSFLATKPIFGPPPTAFLDSPKQARRVRHTDHDARALALGHALAKLIETDPSLLERTVFHLENENPTKRELREWLRILNASSPAQVRKLLVDPGERATRLRQSLPFSRALSARERRALLRVMSDE